MTLWGYAALRKWKYKRLRSDVYQVVLAQVVPFLPAPLTDLTAIDAIALSAFDTQWRPFIQPGRAWSHWDWRTIFAPWASRIDRFEVAVWSGTTLCGLAIGKPSLRRNNMSIYVLQGSPDVRHALKGQILSIVLETATAYGIALGCKELRLVNPLSGILPKYLTMRFTLVQPRNAAPYCSRPI